MRRYVLALLVAGSVLTLAGCGGGGLPETELPAGPAPPQRHVLGWEEREPAEGDGLTYRVRAFEVTPTGWRAEIGIDNRTSVTWRLGNAVEERRVAPAGRFGLLVLPTGDIDSIEAATATSSLPPVRAATSITPPPPDRLDPGALWDGTMEGTGRLPAGLWVRVSFGLMTTDETPPEGLHEAIVWFSDNTLQLRG